MPSFKRFTKTSFPSADVDSGRTNTGGGGAWPSTENSSSSSSSKSPVRSRKSSLSAVIDKLRHATSSQQQTPPEGSGSDCTASPTGVGEPLWRRPLDGDGHAHAAAAVDDVFGRPEGTNRCGSAGKADRNSTEHLHHHHHVHYLHHHHLKPSLSQRLELHDVDEADDDAASPRHSDDDLLVAGDPFDHAGPLPLWPSIPCSIDH